MNSRAYISCLLLFTGCTALHSTVGGNNTKDSTHTNAHQASSANIVPSMETEFPISARTKMFIQNYKTELEAAGADVDAFVPSADLIEKYSLTMSKGTCFVSGFIKIDDKFSESQFEGTNVWLSKPAGDIRTVQIPLPYFHHFLQHKNINYFEISNRVQLK